MNNTELKQGSGVAERKCPDNCTHLYFTEKTNPACSRYSVFLGWVLSFNKEDMHKNGVYRYIKCKEK